MQKISINFVEDLYCGPRFLKPDVATNSLDLVSTDCNGRYGVKLIYRHLAITCLLSKGYWMCVLTFSFTAEEMPGASSQFMKAKYNNRSHRITWLIWEMQSSARPILHKAGQVRSGCSDLTQSNFGYLPGWRICFNCKTLILFCQLAIRRASLVALDKD